MSIASYSPLVIEMHNHKSEIFSTAFAVAFAWFHCRRSFYLTVCFIGNVVWKCPRHCKNQIRKSGVRMYNIYIYIVHTYVYMSMYVMCVNVYVHTCIRIKQSQCVCVSVKRVFPAQGLEGLCTLRGSPAF